MSLLIGMTAKRWAWLMNTHDPEATLTPEEVKLGWHFCPEWDELLVGPGMTELECCTCKKEQTV